MTENQAAAIELIKSFEGYRATAYLDSAHVPTIGYGTTRTRAGTVKLGMTCTLEQANQWLTDYCFDVVFPVLSALNLPGNVFVALSSFLYNTGRLGPKILKAINFRNWKELGDAMMLYVNADGKIIPGLVKRRAAEVEYMRKH